MGLIALIALMWTCLLLTVSYFVLLTLEKATGSVKAFGKLVVAVLLLSALTIGATGAYIAVTGNCPLMGMMQERCKMMCGQGGGMRCGSMSDMGSKCGATTKPAPVQAQ